jgi:hypothetical protein
MDRYYIKHYGDHFWLRREFEGWHFTIGVFPSSMSESMCNSFAEALNSGSEIANNMLEDTLKKTVNLKRGAFRNLIPKQKPFFNKTAFL